MSEKDQLILLTYVFLKIVPVKKQESSRTELLGHLKSKHEDHCEHLDNLESALISVFLNQCLFEFETLRNEF